MEGQATPQHRSRPSLSIEMPPVIDVSCQTSSFPRTPTQADCEESMLKDPPPPPKQPFRVRRRRGTLPVQESDILSDHSIIPTIEMSEALSEELSSPSLHPAPMSQGLLSPLHIHRMPSEPKTPAPRAGLGLHAIYNTPTHEWSLINDSRDQNCLDRAPSICSSFSDSSVSSCGSSAFSAPHGGSCASPDSEMNDPFVADTTSTKHADPILLSPNPCSSPQPKRVKTARKFNWTPAMDHHLWMTYMQYITDPRLTPFKMLPGTAPPLGVCSRVATKAKRTWSQHRALSPGLGMDHLGPLPEAPSLKADAMDDDLRSENEARQPQWPRSEGVTRRRLKELCKRKPSLHAHYQRLLRTRTPSPFTSSTPASRSSEAGPSTAFSSRELNVSLVAATAPSMQPEGPLARLTSDQDPPRPQTQPQPRPTDWFARIGRSQAHQKSLSLHSGLALAAQQSSSDQPTAFDLDRAHLLHSMITTRSLGRTDFAKSGKAPSLDAPVEINATSSLPRSLKRRFKSDEEKPKRPSISGLFPRIAERNATVIVRNRGFTVGAVRATDTLTKLFEPMQANQDHIMTEDTTAESDPFVDASQAQPAHAYHTAPRRLAEPVPRLGSPFVELQSTRQHNTFPRAHIPSLASQQPFQQRLRQCMLPPHGGDDSLIKTGSV